MLPKREAGLVGPALFLSINRESLGWEVPETLNLVCACSPRVYPICALIGGAKDRSSAPCVTALRSSTTSPRLSLPVRAAEPARSNPPSPHGWQHRELFAERLQ